MKCSIVIRAYNEAEHIAKLLVGISRQSLVPHEVIVVDSGSTDDTVAIAREHGATIVTIDKRDFTFGRALNRGCEAASGDILVFASAHVYPRHHSWLSHLVRPFEDERVVLSYGKQRGDRCNHYSEHQIFAKWFPNESTTPQRSYFCNNANTAVRRSAWENRRYDEALTGLEDLDWARRAQAEGEWIAYVASAEIIHVHEESWSTVRNRYRREALAMRRIDESVKFGRVDFVRLLCANTVNDLWHALLEGKLRAEMKSILAFRYNQMVGTYQGHQGPDEISEALRRRFYYPVSRAEKRDDNQTDPEDEIDYETLMRKTVGHNLQGDREHMQTQLRH